VGPLLSSAIMAPYSANSVALPITAGRTPQGLVSTPHNGQHIRSV